MNHSTTFTCRIMYFNMPVLYLTMVPLLAVYLTEIIVLILRHQTARHAYFTVLWIVFGGLVPVLLAPFLATVRSCVTIHDAGVTEIKGHFWGVFKKTIELSWSGFLSWDCGLVLLPGMSKKVRQLTLYRRNGGRIKVHELCKGLSYNGTPSSPDIFFSNAEAFLAGSGLPRATPDSRSAAKTVVSGVGVMLGLTVFVASFLLVNFVLFSGKMGRVGVVGGVVLAGLIAGSLRAARRPRVKSNGKP